MVRNHAHSTNAHRPHVPTEMAEDSGDVQARANQVVAALDAMARQLGIYAERFARKLERGVRLLAPRKVESEAGGGRG